MIKSILSKAHRVRNNPRLLINRLRKPRPVNRGGMLVNTLGLQVTRAVKERVVHHLRLDKSPAHIKHYVDTLEKDGFLVIENFLPSEQFSKLEEELAKIEQWPDSRFRKVQVGDNFEFKTTPVTNFSDEAPAFMELLRDNPVIYDLAMAVARRHRRSYKPHIDLQWVYKPNHGEPCDDYDYNSYLHSDRHYHFAKAFFYLRDVSAECAPYTYVRSSHRFNWNRLKYEYKMSRQWPRLRWARQQEVFNQEQKREQGILQNIAKELIAGEGLEIVQISAKKNTLIISDNAGLHCRGPLETDGPRVTANMDFKFLESAAHHLFPILKRWA